MASTVEIRPATATDGADCAAIYAPYVLETAISFELEPPGPEAMAARIAASERHAWLIARRGEQALGYAYGARLHARAAYRWACEVSVYVARDARAAGVGSALYAALFERLVERGYVTAIAGLTLPNAASRALHAKFGFTEIGVYRGVGFKLGAWHDVLYLQRDLAPRSPAPAEPL